MLSYEDYVKGVSFRFIKPDTLRYADGFGRWNRFLQRFNFSLEMINTRIPEDGRIMRRRLMQVLKIPRMSTFALGAMINKGVSMIKPDQCFVNVGVWNGFSFLAGMSGNSDKKCIGIDNFSDFGNPRENFIKRFNRYKSQYHEFYEMDYRQYFHTVHQGKIGFYIYDGDHSYDNQMNGMRMAEPYFTQGTVILIDDTNWEEVRQSCMDFISQSPNQYKILLDIKTCKNAHPTLWNGVIILQVT